MAPAHSTLNPPPSMCKEWGETLIGLRVRPPNHWWEGERGNNRHDGKLTGFDVEKGNWVFVLDDINDQEPYLMAWEVVITYVDTESSTYDIYQLPAAPVDALDADANVGGKKYVRTKPNFWAKVGVNSPARNVEPIPYTGGDEQFTLNITPEEIEGLTAFRVEGY